MTTATAKKATTRKPAAKKTAPATKPKPQAKAKPVPAKPKVDGQHRAAVLEELRKQGWDGPVSYTVTDLKGVLLPWVAAGCPADAPQVPAGAMNHRHPKPKAERARRISKGYAQALTDLLAQDDPKAWAKALLAEASA